MAEQAEVRQEVKRDADSREPSHATRDTRDQDSRQLRTTSTDATRQPVSATSLPLTSVDLGTRDAAASVVIATPVGRFSGAQLLAFQEGSGNRAVGRLLGRQKTDVGHDSQKKSEDAASGASGAGAQDAALSQLETQAGQSAWARTALGPEPPKELGSLTIAVGPQPPVPSAAVPELKPPEFIPRPGGEGGDPLDRPFGQPQQKARSGGPLLKDVGDRAALTAKRAISWAAYGHTVAELVTAWNLASGPISLFNNASEDPSLKGLESTGWRVPKGGSESLPQLAGEQPGAGKTSVGSLFKPGGSEVTPTKGLDEGVSRARDAAQSKPVGAKNELREALTDLSAAIHEAEAKSEARISVAHEGMANLHALNAAKAQVSVIQNEAAKEAAEQAKASLQKDAEKITIAVQVVGTLLEAIIAAGVEAKAGVGKGVAENAVHELMQKGINAVAEKVADSQYGAKIEEQNNAIKASCKNISDSTLYSGFEQLAAAQERFDKSASDTKTAQEEYLARRTTVKGAYEKVARLAGQASGSDPAVQERVQAMIAAIPIVELVVEKTNNALKVTHVPGADAAVVRGLGMADRGGDPSVTPFVLHVGWLSAYRDDLTKATVVWKARLDELKSVLSEIAGG